MTINQILNRFAKNFNIKTENISFKPSNWGYFFYLILIISFLIVFIISSKLINYQNQKEDTNLNLIVDSKEFKNIGDHLISKINSPYEEIEYIIQNNDSIEKILKKFSINPEDIKFISTELKQKKLTNIFAGRKLTLIVKKLDKNDKTVVNLSSK